MKISYGKYIKSGFLIVIGLSFVYPLLWMINMSFKSASDVFNRPFALPDIWVFSNYSETLQSYNFFSYLRNSIIYCIGTVVITMTCASMFAYCVSRMRWKYSKISIVYISLGVVFPVQVVIIPLFQLLRDMHIRNTYIGLILPYSAFALALTSLMLIAFFRSLPYELEEAACIDGCNVYSSFFKIILPMVKPAIATQVVVIFMNTWNEFFMAFILTNKESIRPITIGLLNFFVGIGTTNWGIVGAAMVISSFPTIIIYLFFNEQIESSLTAGAILK